jgi:hypothetical protein
MRLNQVKDPNVHTHSLQEAIHSHRLHVVLMTLQLRSAQEAAMLYQETLRNVQHRIQRFFAHGLEGLQDDSIPGRPGPLNVLQKHFVREYTL